MRLKYHLVALVCAVGILLSAAPAAMSFPCLAACNKQFTKRAGLNRHQNACIVYKTSLRLKLERRRAVSQKEKTAGSLDKRKDRVNNITVNVLCDARSNALYLTTFCIAKCFSRI
jgi:hypothetical protein